MALNGDTGAGQRIPARLVLALAATALLALKLALRMTLGPLTLTLVLVVVALWWATWRGRAGSGETAAPLTARVRALWALTLLLGLGLCEGTLAVAARLFEGRLRRLGVARRGDGPLLLGEAHFERFLATAFDAQLGWDQPRRFEPYGRARPAPGRFETTLVSAFGDSYTECKGADAETWEALLAARLQTQVVNYGVAGYGPDQALLKFERESRAHPTPIVLFGYMAENVARLVNVYRYAYDTWAAGSLFDTAGRPHWTPTKPRFVVRDEQLVLVPNPVSGPADLQRLLSDPAFTRPLAAHDEFGEAYDLERAVPTLGFPYVLAFPRVAWQVLRRAPRPDPAARLIQDREVLKLLGLVLDEFVRRSANQGQQGVVVLFGQQPDLEYYAAHGRHARLQPVVDLLRARGHAYVDSVALLAAQRKRISAPAPFSSYYDDSSHHSAYAHQVLAEELETWLRAHCAAALRAPG